VSTGAGRNTEIFLKFPSIAAKKYLRMKEESLNQCFSPTLLKKKKGEEKKKD
jgi:hypothetical protein